MIKNVTIAVLDVYSQRINEQENASEVTNNDEFLFDNYDVRDDEVSLSVANRNNSNSSRRHVFSDEVTGRRVMVTSSSAASKTWSNGDIKKDSDGITHARYNSGITYNDSKVYYNGKLIFGLTDAQGNYVKPGDEACYSGQDTTLV